MTAKRDEIMNKQIDKLQDLHKQKLIDLYNNYYEKAIEDTNCFKAFNDCAKELFKGKEDNEIDTILDNLKDGDFSDE